MIIRARDLRIGNWVVDKVTNEAGPVIMICQIDEAIYEGIPLTPELLEKCGFEKDEFFVSVDHPWPNYVKDGVTIELPYFEYVYGSGENAKEIKYLHQLQNLYFALTGQEFEINL